MDAKETLMRIVLLALMLYAAACLAAARRELRAAQGAEEALRLRLEAVEQENLALGRKLSEGCAGQTRACPAGRQDLPLPDRGAGAG